MREIDRRVRKLNEEGFGDFCMDQDMHEKLIFIGGLEEGITKGKAEMRAESVQKLFRCLKKYRVSEAQAFRDICDSFPEMPEDMIRNILYSRQDTTAVS